MTDATTHDPALPRGGDALLWIVRIAAFIGLCISGYLFYIAAQGAAPLGCGESSSCADVLSSRWSKIGPFPVSAPAMAVYLVALAASLHAGGSSPPAQHANAWRILNIAAIAAGGAALWFVYLQFFVLHEVCPFCMAAHFCSLILMAAALIHGPRALPLLGLAGPSALIATQLLLPPPAVALNPHIHFTLPDPATSPILGNENAPITLGLLYDYNCYHCLTTHQHLRAALERYPDQLAIILLPTAIDPRCNKYVNQRAIISRSSCAIARLALAVWIADADQLDAFDAYLVQHIPREKRDGSVPPEVVESVFRVEAERLVGAESLAAALDDPRITKQLETAAEVYSLAVDPVYFQEGVPRILIGELAYPALEDETQLFDLLENTYPQLKPASE